MARRRSRKLELWIGLVTIISVALLFWGYFWLTGQPLGERGYTVNAIFPHTEGLQRGDIVQVSGVEVGVVRSVELEAPDSILVRIWIQRSLRLPRDSRALLESAGVFGDKILVIEPGASTDLLESGDTLRTGEVAGLTEMAADISHRVQAVLGQVDRLLADSTIEQAHGGVAALEGSLRELESLLRENGDEFRTLSRSLANTARSLEEQVGKADVEQAIDDVEATAARLQETADVLKSSAESLASVADKIDRGDGTIGRLINDPGLYEDLQAAIRSINSLTQDIQQNPGRYIKLSIF